MAIPKMNFSKSSGRVPPALLFLLLLALVTRAWAGPAPVDPYSVLVTLDAAGLRVLGLPGTVGQGSSVSILNGRTQQSILVAGLPDGSFEGLLSGVRGDRLQLQVMDAGGSASTTTEIYAASWVIKNPYTSGGYWYVGQGHLHTNHSADGVTPPVDMEAAYFDAGYDFVISTDHRGPPSYNGPPDDGMTPNPDNADRGKDLLWSVGAELSTPQVHMGAWGISSQVPISDLGEIQSAVDAVRARGGIVALNHPGNKDSNSSWDWADDVLPTRGYSLVEAFSGGDNPVYLGSRPHFYTAVDLADAYQQVWWIGTDDLHDRNNTAKFDRYATVVQTDQPAVNEQDLIASADAGRHYIRESAAGPKVVDVGVAGNVITLTLANVASNYNVTWKKRSNQVVKRSPDVDTVSSYKVRGFEGYVTAEIERIADGKRAYIQPLFIANGEDLSVSASNPALVDNSGATVWDAGGTTGSFVVDAGAVRTLNALRIDWDGANGRRFNYLVETSGTGAFAGEETEVVRRTYSNRAALTLDFFDEQARYVKVVVTGQSAGGPATARVREVEIFDASPARTQYYLNNVSGSDTNSGLAGSPWRTFRYASNSMRPRADLNFISSGVPYPGDMSLGPRHSGKHSNATVVYSGDPAVLTPVDATGTNRGIELDNTRYLEWIHFDMYSATSENVRVVAPDATTKIMHNRIHGAQGNYPGGRGIMGWGAFTLAYNLIYGNSSEGAFVAMSGNATNPQIYNNVFYGNQYSGLTIFDQPNINATVRNNISSNNMGDQFSRGTSGSVTDSHNCVAGTYVGAWQKIQSVSGSPLFVNPSAGNFHLQAGSPCIDAGIDVNLFADFAENPINDEPSVPNTGSPGEYSRNFVDIGAVEVQPCDLSACTNSGGCH